MDFWSQLFAPYQNYQNHWIVLELLGTFFGIMSVYFSIKKNILVFPSGIVSTIIYVYLLFVFGLLGDMLINFYYTIMSVYGWVLWSKFASTDGEIVPTKASVSDWKVAIVLFVTSAILVSVIYHYKPHLEHWLNHSLKVVNQPLNWANYVDVFLTSLFLVGMWLMAKKRIENWYFWIVGDFVSIPMYINKVMYITAVQFLVFTIMAIIGYLQWRKASR